MICVLYENLSKFKTFFDINANNGLLNAKFVWIFRYGYALQPAWSFISLTQNDKHFKPLKLQICHTERSEVSTCKTLLCGK